MQTSGREFVKIYGLADAVTARIFQLQTFFIFVVANSDTQKVIAVYMGEMQLWICCCGPNNLKQQRVVPSTEPHTRDKTGQDFLDPTRLVNFKIYAG